MAMTRLFDEDTVIEQVLAAFWTHGWHTTSMADLAKAANIQRGSLYHAYGSKERLFELAFERYASRVLDESRQALEGKTAREAIERFLEVSIDRMCGGTVPRGCFTTRTAVEGNAISAPIQDQLQKLVDQQEALIVAALSPAKIRQSLALSPESTARMIATFTRGLAVMDRIYHSPDRLSDLSRDLVTLLIKP